jgi:hypothetical protein
MSDVRGPFPKGQRVVYIPTHADGNRNHKDCEHGVVSRPGPFVSEVLYDCAAVPHMTTGDEPYTAQATYNRDLVAE